MDSCNIEVKIKNLLSEIINSKCVSMNSPLSITADCYDVTLITVGAGSAGAVVASRLSENPNVTVLLLEAGPAGYPDADIPIVVGDLQNTEIDWKRQTEPQKYCCKSLNNRVS